MGDRIAGSGRSPAASAPSVWVPSEAGGRAFAAALHFAPSAHHARSLCSLPLSVRASPFPGLGRFASKHQPHRGQQEGKDEQGRAAGPPDQGPRAQYARGPRSATCDSPSTARATHRPSSSTSSRSTSWPRSAEGFSKGSRVEVRGALRYSEWESKASPKAKAQKRSKHSVIARELEAAA